MKKPDRFDRLVDKHVLSHPQAFGSHAKFVSSLAGLLRREHAWVVRRVAELLRAQQRFAKQNQADLGARILIHAYEFLLEDLKQRRR